MSARWRLFIDTGGTFTDALAISPEGKLSRAKVLSSGALRGVVTERVSDRVYRVSVAWRARADLLRGGAFCSLRGEVAPARVASFDPADSLIELDGAPDPAGARERAIPVGSPPAAISPGTPFEVLTGEEAPVLAARLLTGTAAGEALPPLDMRLGTTLATNALLTKAGADTAFFITKGFADLLAIGYQQRPDLFALEIRKPLPLPAAIVEVPARLAADGTVLEDLDPVILDDEISSLLARGISCAAVALLHSDRFPEHEQRLADHLRRAGFAHVRCSSELAPAIRILPRATTAVVDAHLAPVVADYLDGMDSAIATGRLLSMTSAGGLIGAASVHAKDLLLSGPAGGVVGAALAGRRAGFSRVLSFDMGGTSSDVARYDGQYEYVFEHSVGDAHLFAPALAIETVAAGGGSICCCGKNGLAVGPESAGAQPGPACYGAGGPLTLTDVNLLLGRLDPGRFGIPVDPQPARRGMEAVLAELRRQSCGPPAVPETVLEGFLEIANERMADAIRRISIRRGYDPADHALVAFGGAGGQHACALADRLGVPAVVVPPDAGLLSAWGLAGAEVERFAERQLLAPAVSVQDRLDELLAELAEEARQSLMQEGIAANDVNIRRRLAELRFAGQETTLTVEIDPAEPLTRTFTRRYEARYGHRLVDREIELVRLRVVASSSAPRGGNEERVVTSPIAPRGGNPEGTQQAWFQSQWREVPVFARDDLPAGAIVKGPALVLEKHAATVIEGGWQLTVDAGGALVMRRAAGTGVRVSDTAATSPEAVQVELFAARFEAVAREMGEALRRTAVSTNVKERLDYSCALLDAAGELVVNAPHIPVHLGSLGLCVRAVRDAVPLTAGDMVVTNHPASGGSHLPDLTVVAPIHDKAGELLGYAVARAHHAEIGGIRPGSMPPNARCLAEEGVVIPPMLIVAGGRARLEEVRRLLEGAPYPSRAVEDNLADLTAAVAACHHGCQALQVLAAAHGSDTVTHYMAALKDKARRRMEEALAALPDGNYRAEERLDDGTVLAARITISGSRAEVDFAGSAAVHPGNLNATPAIVHSVLIYVLRLLVRQELPLNEGLLQPVTLHIPEGILNPPFPDDPALAPSIVGGNVETSQRLVDTLLKALRLCAASQGTMNNVLFGNEDCSYYETVGGGSGAGPGFAGASGVHCHMTNTRATDPEVLELRYPVRLDRFALRSGSGGNGRWRGGDGIVRHLTFLEPLELSLLTQRRREGPYGLDGGEPGARGHQRLVRADGTVEELDSSASVQVESGDRLELETPGGGGCRLRERKTAT